ncbi:putative diacylglycerol o-acyltransferase [Scheffersomyces xylosifermentans]|uniref:putative diacylglycerol o-acyltransferase n=1 Tax=Scheffersomyces xylosifermentans TaxID=1304137 RepID=UPI00315CF76B
MSQESHGSEDQTVRQRKAAASIEPTSSSSSLTSLNGTSSVPLRSSRRNSSTISTSATTSNGSTTSASGKAKGRKKPLLNVAPLNTPLSHRLETVGVIWHTISIPFFICLFLLTVSLGWVVWLTIILPYFVWWYGFDMHTPTNGKVVYRVREWMKNIIIWEWFVNYFPIRVHKTVDLEPTFTDVLVEDVEFSDDEEDLISEDSRTFLDKIFKKLGLSKRLNDTDSYTPPPSNDDDSSSTSSTSTSKIKRELKYKRVSTGPRYIFGYHPHGVISMGAFGSFATNAVRNEPFRPLFKFLKPFFHDPSKGVRLFPGIGNIFPLTLTTQFTLPFFRDYLLGLGLTSASAKNIKSLINNGDNSVCIVVGGAQESLLNNMVSPHNNVGYGFKGNIQEDQEIAEAIEEEEEQEESDVKHEGKNNEKEVGEKGVSKKTNKGKKQREIRLVLHKRKGFVKLAIELGNISLVPTFAFGEADIYKLTIPKPGSMGYAFQQWMKRNFQFTIPFFSARGVFIYDFGFLPYRNPINVCVGRPVHIPQGLVAEYKLKHPDFEDAVPTTTSNSGDKKVSRKGSFTNLFKLNQPKPRRSNVKTKIPPELLDHYHKLYVDELKRVYEENKEKYGYGDVELTIIE